MAVIVRLREAGYVAYLAGGCVRDQLLGLDPKDHDVATDARPPQVQALFPGARPVGEAFGVMLVSRRVRGRRVNIEVATFREDRGYSDGRRPDAVTFTDAEHDARRRDFTVNGLFEDPLVDGGDDRVGRIIDFVGGRRDLEAGLIRAIGDPARRFAEDYLRMLRAVRFAARLGFRVEPDTAAAIRANAARLSCIARERIGQEVVWILEGPAPSVGLDLIQQLRLDGPCLNADHNPADLHLVSSMTRLHPDEQVAVAIDVHGHMAGSEPFAPTLLAAWLLDRERGSGSHDKAGDFGQDDQAPQRLERQISVAARTHTGRWREALCLNNAQARRLKASLALTALAMSWPTMSIAARKRLLAAAGWPSAWRLILAMADGWSRACMPGLRILADSAGAIANGIRDEAPSLIAQGVAPPPLVDGQDLIDLGARPGPSFRQWLVEAYDAQLEGLVCDRAQALAWLAGRIRTADAG